MLDINYHLYIMEEKDYLRNITHIFVDIENVGTRLELFNIDNIKVYFVEHNSLHSSTIGLLKSRYPFIEYINVNVTGDQIADMAIYNKISELYYTDKEHNKFFVVSKDTGFKRFSDVTGIPIDCITLEKLQSMIINTFKAKNEGLFKLIDAETEKEKQVLLNEKNKLVAEVDKLQSSLISKQAELSKATEMLNSIQSILSPRLVEIESSNVTVKESTT